MLMQNFGGTNKEHYGMLWYFWSGKLLHLFVVSPQSLLAKSVCTPSSTDLTEKADCTQPTKRIRLKPHP